MASAFDLLGITTVTYHIIKCRQLQNIFCILSFNILLPPTQLSRHFLSSHQQNYCLVVANLVVGIFNRILFITYSFLFCKDLDLNYTTHTSVTDFAFHTLMIMLCSQLF